MYMQFSKAFKYELIPTKEQEKSFSCWAGTCRFLYNLCLEHRILSWNQYRKGVNYYDQANELKNIKKVDGFEWIKQSPAQILQQALKDLDSAFRNFFNGRGFPKFKKRNLNDSFRFPDPKQFTVERISNKKASVKLPKVGNVKFRYSRPIEGRIRNATISRDGDKWYISFNCEVQKEVATNLGPAIGVDRGINQTIAISEENIYPISMLNLPKMAIIALEKRIAVLQARMKNMTKFSNNWKIAKKQISKLHKKITRIRHDFLHKVSTTLSKNHGLIVLEKLFVGNMSRSVSGTIEEPGRNVKAKSGLNRSILRQGWYAFHKLLEYKVEWHGGKLKLVPAPYSSQECSECHHVSAENRKTQEVFECTQCGHTENADLNAAKIILTRGRRGSACGGVGVAPAIEARTDFRGCTEGIPFL